MPDAKPLQYRLVVRDGTDPAAERARVIEGLLAAPASIDPRYFYDELGCALYGAICQLPEYYPTRTEAALFREHRAQMAGALGPVRQFVDLGAGDCCKGQAWLPFLSPARYVAVDIAAAEIERSLARMAPDYPGMEMVGVVADFAAGLPLDDVLDSGAALFFYPGSSIGNFHPQDARAFLARIRALCASRPGSALLIGVDAKKGKDVLDAAYDDALGVTAAFNRNALRHLNARFGFDFAPEAFAHRGFYSEARGRVEMHLEATGDQVVRLGDRERFFARGERIHTENSYKYHAEEFARLLAEAGFASVRRWESQGAGFFVFLAA